MLHAKRAANQLHGFQRRRIVAGQHQGRFCFQIHFGVAADRSQNFKRINISLALAIPELKNAASWATAAK